MRTNSGHSDHQGMVDHTEPAPHRGSTGHNNMIADFQRRFWISLLITIPILLLSPLIQRFIGLEGRLSFTGDIYVLWVLSSIVFFYGGLPFLRGIYAELKTRSPGTMTLIAIAITTAYAYSTAVVYGITGEVFFWELATLIDVMLLGHWLEMRSVAAASSAVEELARLMPSIAHLVKPDGSTQDISLSELQVGDKVLVKPGEKIPADGKVIHGETEVSEALLTGESLPVTKYPGLSVIGGSLNSEGSITVEVQRTGEDSYLTRITALVRAAQESKSATQNLADRAARGLTIVALSSGILTLLLWLTLAQQPFFFALSRMVTVMVIACPHALGLAIPLVVAVSSALAAQKGLLIKDREGFETARKIQAVIFDKTGTLTLGQFGVTDLISLNGMEENELLQYAASLEKYSEHPIARGVVAGIKEVLPVEEFQNLPGRGVRGKVGARQVMVVSPGYLQENKIETRDSRIDKLADQGKTVIYLIIEGQLAGAVALADIIRPESKRAIKELKGMGISCLMITGDNPNVARWVAQEIGLDEYFAGILPDQKAEKVKKIQSRGLKVAMVGDGINDAPALAQADIGIAIGAGTDVAAATADIVLVKSNPLDAVSAIKLSRATYGKMLQNLAWATGYNVIAIPLAAGAAYSAGIVLDPAVGAALMAISTIIVAINARFLRLK